MLVSCDCWFWGNEEIDCVILNETQDTVLHTLATGKNLSDKDIWPIAFSDVRFSDYFTMVAPNETSHYVLDKKTDVDFYGGKIFLFTASKPKVDSLSLYVVMKDKNYDSIYSYKYKQLKAVNCTIRIHNHIN